MNKKALIIAVMAACMAAGSSAAFAQSRDYRSDHDGRGERHGQSERHDRADRNDRHDGYRHDDRRGGYDRGDRYDNARGGYQGYNHRPSARQHFRRGAYLEREYRGRNYVVSDWRSRRLSAPPRGSHWVHVNGDYALVAIATGLIAQVLLNQ